MLRGGGGLPSDFLDAATVAERFDIAPRAALLSAGSYEVDPVQLTLGLLARARAGGAAMCFPFDVVPDRAGRRDGSVSARIGRAADRGGRGDHGARAMNARAGSCLPPSRSDRATQSRRHRAMRRCGERNAMIWEASSPYLYTRATADGRVIAGGEDEDFDDARQRDALDPGQGRYDPGKAGRDDRGGGCAARLRLGGGVRIVAGRVAGDRARPGAMRACGWQAGSGETGSASPRLGPS